MRRFNIAPDIRISLGLALFTMTLLMGIDMVGVLPDPNKAVLDLRKKTCESLAVYASLAVQKGDLGAIQTTLEFLKKRNEDILSAALRKSSGKVVAKVGDHELNWRKHSGGTSTPTNVQVPIIKGDAPWGTFEVSFKAVHANLLLFLWGKPIVKLLVLVVPLAFIGFYLLMKKTLRHLDPSAVVPERVKVALDSLVEGVVLMDRQERIVLANKAFEKNAGDVKKSLMGQKASGLLWTVPRSRNQVKDFPWQQAMREGVTQTAVPLTLQGEEGNKRTFMVNGAPILDGAGKTRGALATFDDVTLIEKQNTELQSMLTNLEKSRDEIRRQNQELQVLATQDPLTRCLNRRAFYERFEVEFNRAQRYGHNFSCVMVDIDHFKSINDKYGHPVGDKVLQKVSSILRSCMRDSDVVCRYGGEEFCIILPQTDTQGGLVNAERIRRAIAAKSFSGIRVTVSLGVSSFDSMPANPSDLLSQSDKALYAAKRKNRNRVVCYSEEIAGLSDKDFAESASGTPDKKSADVYIPHHVVNALMLALEHRDIATAEHSRKVGELCAAAAQGMMSISECAVLEIAGSLHDIGKLGVPDSILLKPGPLTEDEWKIMRDHERRSMDVIASTFLSPELVEIVSTHSLWYDGSSSQDPARPKGKNIPLGARILNIADAFNAIVSHRPYRNARSYPEAFKELRRCAGTQFDPELVEHFIKVVSARDESRRKGKAPVSDSLKLEIGREVEKIFVAVNTGSFAALSVSAEHLAARATKYGLDRIGETAMEIEKAAMENRDQMEIAQLASKLLELCGSREGLHVNAAEGMQRTMAA
jgi:diguanylate cyclase (GGDEF)-like protein/PAS domain S-box-containing protein